MIGTESNVTEPTTIRERVLAHIDFCAEHIFLEIDDYSKGEEFDRVTRDEMRSLFDDYLNLKALEHGLKTNTGYDRELFARMVEEAMDNGE
jgi:hypothetical protein